jgi:hypothetical protein
VKRKEKEKMHQNASNPVYLQLSPSTKGLSGKDIHLQALKETNQTDDLSGF